MAFQVGSQTWQYCLCGASFRGKKGARPEGGVMDPYSIMSERLRPGNVAGEFLGVPSEGKRLKDHPLKLKPRL